jgi:hypothetical protein
MKKRRNKPFRVRCQFCGIVNYTKNLDMELVCTRSCNKYAKYRYQKLKLTTVHDISNHKWIKVFEPLSQENKILEEIEA